MEKVVSKFLRSLNTGVSEEYIEKIIASHADYPSLLSIVDAFERLGIIYKAGRINKEDLAHITFPYLLPISAGGGDLILVRNRKELRSNEDKLLSWDGVILQAEAVQKTTNSENNRIYAEGRLTKSLSMILLIGYLSALLTPFFSNQIGLTFQ